MLLALVDMSSTSSKTAPKLLAQHTARACDCRGDTPGLEGIGFLRLTLQGAASKRRLGVVVELTLKSQVAPGLAEAWGPLAGGT